MALSGGSASMRRFPGLNLLAWVLISGANTIIKGVNVSAVVHVTNQGSRVDFTQPMPNANYQLEIITSEDCRMYSTDRKPDSVMVRQVRLNDGALESSGNKGMTYVAVYA